jgi:dTDP-4-dehydrorhamnose reductase
MHVLVVGGSGMLGSDLRVELALRGHQVVAPSHEEFDVADPVSSGRILVEEFGHFDLCVNCAAYTAVDKAESEVRAATELNCIAPGYLAHACNSAKVRLIHLSTDFVFDGKSSEPYTEDCQVHPIGVYGRSKEGGEREVLQTHFGAIVVRTSWLFGPNGVSFPRTMIRAWKAGKKLRVVSDQIGRPTHSAELARVIVDIAERDLFPGVYHAVGPEAMAWNEFADRAIRAYARFHKLDSPIEIEPILTADWPTPAKRPHYSVLSTAKLEATGVLPQRPLDESLDDFVAHLEE